MNSLFVKNKPWIWRRLNTWFTAERYKRLRFASFVHHTVLHYPYILLQTNCGVKPKPQNLFFIESFGRWMSLCETDRRMSILFWKNVQLAVWTATACCHSYDLIINFLLHYWNLLIELALRFFSSNFFCCVATRAVVFFFSFLVIWDIKEVYLNLKD